MTNPAASATVVDILMPQLGESVAEGTVVTWLKQVGDRVERDEPLVDLSSDKVDVEFPSPYAGVLQEIIVGEEQTVPIGSVIARLAVIEAETSAKGRAPGAGKPDAPLPPVGAAAPAPAASPQRAAAKKSRDDERFYSPAVRRMAREAGLSLADMANIAGSGKAGRVTPGDLRAYLKGRADQPASKHRRRSPAPPGTGDETAEDGRAESMRQDRRLSMSRMRRAIAEHMVRSVRAAPHITSVSEADVSSLVHYREANREAFRQRQGFDLTYTPFFMAVVAQALRQHPRLNSEFDGETIIEKWAVNIGIAVAVEDGLLAPVVRQADELSLEELARAVNDVTGRTRAGKLHPDDLQGGTFTITNHGVFGGLWATPIIHQPQVAILATGTIKKRPAVIDDALAIRSMMYLALSYDHRVIDGALGDQFLADVVHRLEHIEASVSLA